MRLRCFVLATFLASIAAVQISPLASAEQRAPPTLVVDVVGFTDYGNGTWIARLNFTFERSPDDAGSFGYTICGYTTEALPTDVASGAQLPYTCLSANSSIANIPSRSGWAYGGDSKNVDHCAGTPANNYCATVPAIQTYNVTAWDGTSPSTGCSVRVDFSSVPYLANDPGATFGHETVPTLLFPHGDPDYASGKPTYHSCGVHANLADVPGVNAIVTSPYFGANNSTFGSLTLATWRLSPSDSNQTSGDFDYYFFHRFSDPPQSGLVVRGILDGRDASDSAGIRQNNVTGFDEIGSWSPLYVQVVARDNLTHQQSNLSCEAFVKEGILGSAGGCGNLAAPDSPVAVGSGPSFPGLDVPAFATATGLPIENAGYALTGLLVLGLVIVGAKVAGGVGAGVLGALAVALAFLLHIIPAWLLVLLFTLCVLAVVVSAQRGRKG